MLNLCILDVRANSEQTVSTWPVSEVQSARNFFLNAFFKFSSDISKRFIPVILPYILLMGHEHIVSLLSAYF